MSGGLADPAPDWCGGPSGAELAGRSHGLIGVVGAD